MSTSRRIRRQLGWVALASATVLSACDGQQPAGQNGLAPSASTSPPQALIQCPSTPAAALFPNALCVCDDLHLVGAAVSTHRVGQAAASVGVNGLAHLVGEPKIDGDFTAWAGISGTGQLSVTGDLVTTGELSSTGRIAIDKDLFVGGNLMQVGELIVGGLLRVAGIDSHIGERQIAGTGSYSTPAAPPCGCDAAATFDVALAVSDARSQNDNNKVSLASAITSVGAATITLPTGVYYLDSIDTVGEHKLRIEGAVALYVSGDIDLVGKDSLDLAPGASLDLYVSGAVRSVGELSLGDAQHASLFRLYIGGAAPVVVQVGQQELNGLIYAPKATVSWVGQTVVRGAVFAGKLDGVGDLSIEYDGGTLAQPAPCDPAQPLATPGSDQPILVR